MKKLSVIIPAYNEAYTIAKLIKRVKAVKLPKGISKEIVVVNDASSDGTLQIIKKIKGIKVYSHKENIGKGAAVRTGIKRSTGDVVIIQDADLEYDPNDYPKLIKPIMQGKARVVYGSRLKNYPVRLFGKKRTPLLSHYLGNKLLTLITNVLFGDGITDMETCYKVFEKDVVAEMTLHAKRFELEPEITAKILKKGIKIVEIPIKVKPRGYEEGKKITWRDGFIAVWTLVKYRLVD